MNWQRIVRLIKKEFLQTFRDKRLLRMLVMTSIIQLFVFGYGVSTDVNRITTAVLDEDRTAVSRAFTDRFIRSGYFVYTRTGTVQMVLRIPYGFTKAMSRGQTAKVQTILDGSDSMTAGIIAGYVGGVVRDYSAQVRAERFERVKGATTRIPDIEGRVRVWYNPELKSVNFMVPGVLCMILLIVTMMMTSLAIVKEKEIGTLEQLIVTPLTPYELMIGKTIPFLLIGLADMAIVLAVAVLWFHITLAGSVALLFALTILFLLTNLGLGLFVSTISKTQQEATMTSFFLLLPSMLLSGFMFPIANMPQVVQWITYAIPMRYFLEIIRGIFLKGSGIDLLWPQVLVLAVFAIGILTVSAARFQKRLG
ncbi:MAG: Inner membrane transport permease YbhR [bacterium ADurb.Bin429]|nr:MAG: Inner membrane transport permease YbhR [bacterium ADurb.Bin429]